MGRVGIAVSNYAADISASGAPEEKKEKETKQMTIDEFLIHFKNEANQSLTNAYL